jgi:autotransporter-associated beta strand protein
MLLARQFASAAIYTWNWTNGVSADIYWSDGLNWSPVGVPGPLDSLIFNNTNSGGNCVAPGAGLNVAGGGQSQINFADFNGLVDAKFGGAISAMLCSNLSGTYQNILITNNTTLTITNGLTVGNGVAAATGGITPGSGGTDYGVTIANVTIAGTNATLLMNNTNENLWVAEGSATSSSSLYATLDLSALDNFDATISRLLVGLPAVNRPGSFLYLAATNNITAEFQTTGILTSDTVGTGAIVVGEGSSNSGSAPDDLYLGLVNNITADTIAIARQKQAHCLVAFNPNLTGPQIPTATFQGFTSSRVATWDIGDGVVNSGTDTCVGTVDFSLGIVNAMVNAMYVGKGPTAGTAANASTGALTFGAGTFNVNTLYIGYQNNTSLPYGSGTVTVNTNSTITNYATLVVNSNLYLTYAIPTAPAFPGAIGVLNIAGGAVWANNITSATNGHGTINMTAGTLVISNSAGTVGAPVSNLNLTGTIQLSVSSTVPEMVALNLNLNGPVTVNIAALPPILQYPVDLPLMQYVSSLNGSVSQVVLGNVPAGSPAFQGYISNNVANSSIDLILTNGPLIKGLDVWTGAAGSNWDSTSLNWANLGAPAAFSAGSSVQFDDTASGPTNVNLTTALAPSKVTVSNSLLSYTFSGPGAISGAAALTKAGTNTLLLANTGINTFSGGLVISNGTVQFGNGGADGNLPANTAAILDNGTLIFDQGPNVSVANAITGSGSVMQEGLDALDLTGSNSYSGLTLVSSGTLLLDGWLNGGMLTNLPGTTVGGNGTNLGPFSVAGTVNPGDVGANRHTDRGRRLDPGGRGRGLFRFESRQQHDGIGCQ